MAESIAQWAQNILYIALLLGVPFIMAMGFIVLFSKPKPRDEERHGFEVQTTESIRK